MGATHLAEQAKQRHDDYLKAEISSLRAELRTAEDKINALLARLDQVERNLGWPGK